MYSNDNVTLSHYKTSLRGKIQDYKIVFQQKQQCVHNVIRIASDIVKQLIDDLHAKDQTIMGRLVARVTYHRTSTEEVVSYYHPSFQAEVIEESENFFITHMLKIAQRMESMNEHGSNLLIKSIDEIHLHISVCN